MTTICGIDEAGRGPVIGPMVLCGACFDEGKSAYLRTIGVKDSKMLSPEERDFLFEKIIEACGGRYYAVIVSPSEIDEAVSRGELNLLEAHKTAEIINFLNPDTAIIDCPDPKPDRYASKIRAMLKNKNLKILAEHKADFKYAEVGAASILAKVIRDREIEKISRKLGIDFGSGYPSDPRTAEFIQKHWNEKSLHGVIRRSWAPVRRREGEKGQMRLSEF